MFTILLLSAKEKKRKKTKDQSARSYIHTQWEIFIDFVSFMTSTKTVITFNLHWGLSVIYFFLQFFMRKVSNEENISYYKSGLLRPKNALRMIPRANISHSCIKKDVRMVNFYIHLYFMQQRKTSNLDDWIISEMVKRIVKSWPYTDSILSRKVSRWNKTPNFPMWNT